MERSELIKNLKAFWNKFVNYFSFMYLIKGTFMKFRRINNTNITTTSDITILNSTCVKISIC